VALATDYALRRLIARFDETEREALAAGIIIERELQRWHTSLDRANTEDAFFGSVTQMLVAGRKTT
jgi:hypothetical protein